MNLRTLKHNNFIPSIPCFARTGYAGMDLDQAFGSSVYRLIGIRIRIHIQPGVADRPTYYMGKGPRGAPGRVDRTVLGLNWSYQRDRHV
jgi:hypothetical protein